MTQRLANIGFRFPNIFKLTRHYLLAAMLHVLLLGTFSI